MENTKKFTEANRIAWNKAMPYHRKSMDGGWDKLLSDTNSIWQEDPKLAILRSIAD